LSFINKKRDDKIKELLIKTKRNPKCDMCTHEDCNLELFNKFFCKKHKNCKIKSDYKLNLPYLRSAIMKSDKDLTDDEKWLKEVPYDTRQLMIKEFIGAFKAILTNYKNGNINHFKMNFKSKKSLTQTFNINKNALKIIDGQLELFKRRKIGSLRVRNKMKKWIKKNLKKIDCDCKIIKYRPSEYYLLLPIKKKVSKTIALQKVVSLDPGVRTFQTFYSSDGLAGKLGDNFAYTKIASLNERIDKLNSIKSNKRGQTKRNISNRQHKLRTKVKNVVSDMHWKVANFLCENFETIILPSFETKNMVSKKKELLPYVRRSMLSLCHYKFKEKLICKARERHRNLFIVDESFTSKTCGCCGEQNNNLGGKKVFNCQKCGTIMDRDLNGARNILLKFLSEMRK
jgi:putative transposase